MVESERREKKILDEISDDEMIEQSIEVGEIITDINDTKKMKLKYYKFYYKFLIPFSYLRNLFGLLMASGVKTDVEYLLKNNEITSNQADYLLAYASRVMMFTVISNIIHIIIKSITRNGLANKTKTGYNWNFILLILTPFSIALTTYARGEIQNLGIRYNGLESNMDSIVVLSIMHFMMILILWTIPNIYYFYRRKSLFTNANQKGEVTGEDILKSQGKL